MVRLELMLLHHGFTAQQSADVNFNGRLVRHGAGADHSEFRLVFWIWRIGLLCPEIVHRRRKLPILFSLLSEVVSSAKIVGIVVCFVDLVEAYAIDANLAEGSLILHLHILGKFLE